MKYILHNYDQLINIIELKFPSRLKRLFQSKVNTVIVIFLIQFIAFNCNMLNKQRDYYPLPFDVGLLLYLIHEHPKNSYYNSLEIYNKNLNRFESLPSSLTHAKIQHRSTLLNDGKVLITGGYNHSDYTISSVDLYDPVDNTIIQLADMNERRSLHTQTLLNDGKVLITGGFCIYERSSLNTAEIFDPSTQTFEKVGSMNFNRCSHGAALLPDGKVLIAGGTDPKTDIAVKETEIYDPSTKTFTVTSELINPRKFGIRMVVSDSGEPFIFGGNDGSVTMSSIESFNLVENKFEAKNELNFARNVPDVIKLENGKILLAGGSQIEFRGSLNTSEIFDPTQNIFLEGPKMSIGRHGQNATLLNNGNVLISGGRNIIRRR